MKCMVFPAASVVVYDGNVGVSQVKPFVHQHSGQSLDFCCHNTLIAKVSGSDLGEAVEPENYIMALQTSPEYELLKSPSSLFSQKTSSSHSRKCTDRQITGSSCGEADSIFSSTKQFNMNTSTSCSKRLYSDDMTHIIKIKHTDQLQDNEEDSVKTEHTNQLEDSEVDSITIEHANQLEHNEVGSIKTEYTNQLESNEVDSALDIQDDDGSGPGLSEDENAVLNTYSIGSKAKI
nr:uncharacterized protein LOC128700661 [Cherax quadricarinatus]